MAGKYGDDLGDVSTSGFAGEKKIKSGVSAVGEAISNRIKSISAEPSADSEPKAAPSPSSTPLSKGRQWAQDARARQAAKRGQ